MRAKRPLRTIGEISLAGIFDLKPYHSVSNPLSRYSRFLFNDDRLRRALLLLILAASLFLPLNAEAAGSGTMLTELRSLMAWIVQQAVEKMPAVATVGRAELHSLAFGRRFPRAVNNRDLNVYGLYDFDKETIYLLDSVDLESERGRSILNWFITSNIEPVLTSAFDVKMSLNR